MRALYEPVSKYQGLEKALKNAIRVYPGPEYFTRILRLRLKFEADVRNRYASQGNPPYPLGVDRADEFLSSVNWDRKPHLGACFSVLPDRMQEIGRAHV